MYVCVCVSLCYLRGDPGAAAFGSCCELMELPAKAKPALPMPGWECRARERLRVGCNPCFFQLFQAGMHRAMRSAIQLRVQTGGRVMELNPFCIIFILMSSCQQVLGCCGMQRCEQRWKSWDAGNAGNPISPPSSKPSRAEGSSLLPGQVPSVLRWLCCCPICPRLRF